jgi:DNA topoisomerase-1
MNKKKKESTKKTYENINSNSTHVNILNTPFLVIVESPSKCKKIESFLGFQYKCIASKGHIRELKKVGKDYTPEFEIIEEKANHVVWMKQIVSQFLPENIFLGTDDDREGEAIAWHICKVCGISVETTQRILFHEVTEFALKRAVANPLFIRMNIVKAQQTRQIIDRMIGFRVSPVLSRMVSHEQTNFLSAGRCQTPTLKLIYDRKVENDTTTKKNDGDDSSSAVEYKIVGSFFPHPSTLTAVLNISQNEVETFMEDSKDHKHIFKIDDKISKVKSPPSPFKTSILLQTANSVLHLSPKYVMDACQTLYQDGKITYMRTESMTYAKGFLSQCKSFIEEQYGASYVGKNIDKLENNTDNNNPHEAIRVTYLTTLHTDYEDKKINDIYQLIRQRTLESCMHDFQYDHYKIDISAPSCSSSSSSSSSSSYIATIEVPTFLGWKRFSTKPEEMTKTQVKLSNDIQFWKKFRDKPVPFIKIEAVLHMTECDRYYNEASLIQKLESLGIGRPSTFSMLTDTIQERKYVRKQDIDGKVISGKEYTLHGQDKRIIETREVQKVFGAAKNKLCIQELGMQVIHKLEGFASIFEYSYTSLMEKELDEIVENPEKDWKKVCETCDDNITACLKPLQLKMKNKYALDECHSLIFGKSGMVVQYHKEGEEKTYKTVKPSLDLDFAKLENNEYSLDDILERKDECLGKFENEDVYLKSGKYGPYVTYGNTKLSIKPLVTKKMSLEQITIAEVEKLILSKKTTKEESTNSILRVLSKEASVRKGKFGNYILYKTADMKKPSFINLTNCPYHVLEDDVEKVCQWVHLNLKKIE